jgi:hypothetical protein
VGAPRHSGQCGFARIFFVATPLCRSDSRASVLGFLQYVAVSLEASEQWIPDLEILKKIGLPNSELHRDRCRFSEQKPQERVIGSDLDLPAFPLTIDW